jgi:hypothetical protein
MDKKCFLRKDSEGEFKPSPVTNPTPNPNPTAPPSGTGGSSNSNS